MRSLCKVLINLASRPSLHLSGLSVCTSSKWNLNHLSSCLFSTLHPPNTGRPKHPMNAYFLYMRDKRQSMAHANPREFVKSAAQKWREMTEHEKKPYLDEQKELQEIYRAQLASFNSIHSKEEKQAFLEDFRHNKLRRKKKIHKKQVLETGRPKRNRSALAFYVSLRFSAIRVGNVKEGAELLKDIINSWKTLFSHQKQPFYDRAEEDKERYHQEIQEYMQKMKAEGKTSLLPVKYQKLIASQERKELKMKKG